MRFGLRLRRSSECRNRKQGFALPGGWLPTPGPNTLFWGGYGGSLAIIDLDARTSFAYVMNRLAGPMWDARGLGLVTAMWQALGLV